MPHIFTDKIGSRALHDIARGVESHVIEELAHMLGGGHLAGSREALEDLPRGDKVSWVIATLFGRMAASLVAGKFVDDAV